MEAWAETLNTGKDVQRSVEAKAEVAAQWPTVTTLISSVSAYSLKEKMEGGERGSAKRGTSGKGVTKCTTSFDGTRNETTG